jgi:hypothetical protein
VTARLFGCATDRARSGHGPETGAVLQGGGEFAYPTAVTCGGVPDAKLICISCFAAVAWRADPRLVGAKGSRPPSDSQIANESGGQLWPAERLQPVSYAGEELRAPDIAECVSARLRGQVGEVIIGTVEDLEG